MSDSGAAPRPNAVQKPLPGWFASGVLGAVLGGGIAFLALHFYGYHLKVATPEARQRPEGAPGPTMGPGALGGGSGGGMGGGMGGGGGGGEKRNLTSLVGKLDLLSQGVRVELTGEQAAALREKLTALNEAETMTGDDAQEQLEAIEGILTDEQKATLASIDLPRGGRGGGGAGRGGPGGPGGPTPPGGGGPGGPGGPPGMGGPGGGANDDNPFKSEANSQHLTDLLERLQSRG